MTDFKVGDRIRLKNYEGHVGFGTPESHSVWSTKHEGTVTRVIETQRFGAAVQLDTEDDEVYLEDFDVIERVGVEVCPCCKGRGFVEKKSGDQQ